ncbi:MAG: Rrf2 family transcriptional regulator [Oscillospiraceae bacterium]|jgi:Rrf2 family protein|nr:Rrf2 family transcriptional regulator [Oscillospiraceae bacterium]
MKVSTKGRYALRMLLDLAEHKESGFVSLKEIAIRQNISKQYLEQIVTLLNTSDVLKTNRGKQGGYMLAKSPSQITVGQILRITEGNLSPVACLEDEVNRCERSASCKTLPMWDDFYTVITNYLDNVTVQDMLEQYQTQGADHYIV